MKIGLKMITNEDHTLDVKEDETLESVKKRAETDLKLGTITYVVSTLRLPLACI